MAVFSSPQPRAAQLQALLQEHIGDQGCTRRAVQGRLRSCLNFCSGRQPPRGALRPSAGLLVQRSGGRSAQKKETQEASLVKVGPTYQTSLYLGTILEH
jgi:hypothetical protein